MTTANENPAEQPDEQASPSPAAGGRLVSDPALTPEHRDLIQRAAASLPDDAPARDIAAKAIQMAKDERGTSWVELVDDGWTFGADEVRRVLGRD